MAKELDKIKNNVTYKKILFYPITAVIITILTISLGLIFTDNDTLAILSIFFLIGITPLAAIGSAIIGFGAFKTQKKNSLLIASIISIIILISVFLFFFIIK